MNSVLKYIGMKNVDLEKYGFNNYELYCEPFSGSFNTGFKLFEKGYKGKLIYNDIDERVVNFWLKLKDNSDKLYERCNQLNNLVKQCITNDERVRLVDNWSKSRDDFKRAASEFIIRQYLTMDGIKWSLKNDVSSIFDFYLTSEALQSVEINNLDYKEVIQKHDSNNTFFMIDPPYDISKVNVYYRGQYRQFNHDELADVVKTIKGNWLLTYNDNKHIRELYKDYNIQEMHRQLFGKTYTELYITRR